MKQKTPNLHGLYSPALLVLVLCGFLESNLPLFAGELFAQDQSVNPSNSEQENNSEQEKIEVRLQVVSERIVIGNLPAELQARFQKISEAGGDLGKLINVVVGDKRKPNLPAILGKCTIINDQIVFSPRFPFESDTRYTLRLLDPDSPERQLIVVPFELRGHASDKLSHVSAVYPSASKLPENLLKFYIHFSRPMSRGDSYDHIKLMDESGAEVDLPFLELGEELWNRDGTRFTLLFDPGRVKRGLKPREEEGAPLIADQKYRLVIKPTWQDANGKPLEKQFEKSFSVVDADYLQPHPDDWKLTFPEPGTLEPLVVKSPESLDRALLEHAIGVLDSTAAELAGEIEIADSERTWKFTPQTDWSAGEYSLRVEHYLEDMAGNSVGRAFEVELKEDRKKNTNRPVFLKFKLESQN